MKVIGKGNIHVFGPVDECPHHPGEEANWQETSNRAQGGSGAPYIFPASPGILENGIFPACD